jgi:hypothetical protein
VGGRVERGEPRETRASERERAGEREREMTGTLADNTDTDAQDKFLNPMTHRHTHIHKCTRTHKCSRRRHRSAIVFLYQILVRNYGVLGFPNEPLPSYILVLNLPPGFRV